MCKPAQEIILMIETFSGLFQIKPQDICFSKIYASLTILLEVSSLKYK